jgi:hypothetical protein
MKKIKLLGVLFLFLFVGISTTYAADFSDLNNNGIEDESEVEVIVNSNKTLPAGNYLFGNLILINNAILYVNGDPLSSKEFKGVKITATNLTINPGSSINADAQGFAGDGPGSLSGGYPSYGGIGWNGTPTSTYGSASKPTDLGSGQGQYYRGGGVLHLVIVDALTNNGKISANGDNNYGSGGSVYVTANKMFGTGTFSAHGGYSAGGGRIALYYQQNSFTGTTDIAGGSVLVGTPYGWGVYANAGSGTIGLFDTQNNDLTINSDWHFKKSESPFVFNKITVESKDDLVSTVTMDEDVIITANELILNSKNSNTGVNLFLSNNVVITIPTITVNKNSMLVFSGSEKITSNDIFLNSYGALTIVPEKTLSLTIPNLTVSPNASFNANKKGFVDNGPGSLYGEYPSYGGAGWNRAISSTYGSSTQPVDLGSGTAPGYRGGGALRLVITDTLINNGSISANGDYLGSGGSVYVTANKMFGTGTFSAHGGYGAGGGRIALYYQQNSFTGVTNVAGGPVDVPTPYGWSNTAYANSGTVVFGQSQPTNIPPTLTPLSDLDFSDGINPNKGVANKDLLTFKTIYTDQENVAPTKMDVVIRNTVDFDTDFYKEQLTFLGDNAEIVNGHTTPISDGKSILASLKRENVYQATTTVVINVSSFNIGDVYADVLFEALDSSYVVIGKKEETFSFGMNDKMVRSVEMTATSTEPISFLRVAAIDTNDTYLWVNKFELGEKLPMKVDIEDASTTLKNGKFDDGEQYTASSKFPKGKYSFNFETADSSLSTSTESHGFTTGYSNVAFLPGLEASRLYQDYECTLPGSPWIISTCTKRLWEPHNPFDNTLLFMNPDGTSIQGGIYTKDVIDNAYVWIKGNVYWSLLEQLYNMKRDGDIAEWKTFPYDWRYDVRDVVKNPITLSGGNSYSMVERLKELADSSDTGKVTIIAHSNGGLIAKTLTNELGAATSSALIEQIILVASPQAGTPSAAGAILHGFQQGLPTDWAPLILTKTTARTLATNMPSAYGLLPSLEYSKYVSDPVITFATASNFSAIATTTIISSWIIKYGGEIHSGNDLENFMTDTLREDLLVKEELGQPTNANWTLYEKANTLHTTIDKWIPPAGVQLTEIAGWGEETLRTIKYYEGVENRCIKWNIDDICLQKKKFPILEYKMDMTIDGDGTVVVPSALWTATSTGVGKYWVDLNKYNIPFIRIRKHADIFEVPELRTFIQNLIVRNGFIPEKYIKTEAPPTNEVEKKLTFTLHSPLTLNLYDDLGNHTGISTTTNEVEENITGSRYMTFGEVQYISVPASSNVHLKMNGYAEGSFTLDVEQKQGDTVIEQTTFAGIPSATTTVATMDISANSSIASSSPLLVDENGDGKTDITLEPKLGEVVLPDLIPPEISVSFSTSTQDVSIIGTDNEGIQTTKTTATSTTITDKGGNTLIVPFIKYKEKQTKLKVTFNTLIYNGIATKIPQTTLEYDWEIRKDGTLKSLSQDIQIKKTRDISAEYESKKNETKIEDRYKVKERKDDEEDERDTTKITKKGMVLLKFSTDKGGIKINY